MNHEKRMIRQEPQTSNIPNVGHLETLELYRNLLFNYNLSALVSTYCYLLFICNLPIST